MINNQTTISPTPFHQLKWSLKNGVSVRTEPYDDSLYAFEVTQYGKCLGTIIPNDEGDMHRLKYMLDNGSDIDGMSCNDDFDTVICVNK